MRVARGRTQSVVASAERLTGSWRIGRRDIIWLSASYVHSLTNLIVLSSLTTMVCSKCRHAQICRQSILRIRECRFCRVVAGCILKQYSDPIKCGGTPSGNPLVRPMDTTTLVWRNRPVIPSALACRIPCMCAQRRAALARFAQCLFNEHYMYTDDPIIFHHPVARARITRR